MVHDLRFMSYMIRCQDLGSALGAFHIIFWAVQGHEVAEDIWEVYLGWINSTIITDRQRAWPRTALHIYAININPFHSYKRYPSYGPFALDLGISFLLLTIIHNPRYNAI